VSNFRRLAFHVVGSMAVVFGIMILVGSVLLYQPGKQIGGGIIVLVFSIEHLDFRSNRCRGYMILGIIGGALALAKK
jgi:hypothetical protein